MADITPYQLIVPLASFLLITYAWNLVLRQKKSIWEGLLWTVFWAAIATIALVPQSLQVLSAVTGIKKNENAALITAIGILFFIIFYLVMRIEELEQRLTSIIRAQALRSLEEHRH